MKEDQLHMRRALRLARLGRGRVSPGALVGAVVVRDGVVAGEGAYRRRGGPHAEIEALAAAGERCRGATLFVTLEPCAHHGTTPPCAEAVAAAGISRVVCALEDPDERVRGRGFARLRDAGIAVEVGLLAPEAERDNAAFLTHRRTGKPWVVLKLAQSLDGRIATRTGQSRWITGKLARRHAHRWRSWVDGVVVGAGTVLCDDPELTVRHVRGRDPRPMVVDGRLRVSPGASLFRRGTAVLITADSTPEEARRKFEAAGAEIWTFPSESGRLDLRDMVRTAGERGMISLLIEGGRDLATSALADRIVDQLMLHVAPRLLGAGISGVGDLGIELVDKGITLERMELKRLGDDALISGKVVYPCSPG